MVVVVWWCGADVQLQTDKIQNYIVYHKIQQENGHHQFFVQQKLFF